MIALYNKLLMLLLLYAVCSAAWAGNVYFNIDGVAIHGFDPVAYFAQDAAVKGNQAFSYEWKGVTWWFSSAENRDKFAATPQDFAPQYGGFCAYAMAEGKLAKTDARAWTTIDGKLYLNYSKYIRTVWQRAAKRRYIKSADKEWKRLVSGH